MAGELPEVVFLADARGERPENAAGAGDFWYEPEVWTLPLSPAAKVLYASACSFIGHGGIHRHDLRAALKDSSDEEIAATFGELSEHGLLSPTPRGYEVRSVKEAAG